MYIPFFPDFVVITSAFFALGFGVAWAIQSLRRPPPPLPDRLTDEERKALTRQ